MALILTHKMEFVQLLICLNGLFLKIGCSQKNSWQESRGTQLEVCLRKNRPKLQKGLADGQLASLIDNSFVVSYHYKESGRLFCSGVIINEFWTVSVPNCFHIPIHYYRNKKNGKRKRDLRSYPFVNVSLEESALTHVLSTTENRDLRKVIVLNPEIVVVLTVFDKAYIPCKSNKGVKTAKKIIVHWNYRIPSHNAEIALVKVSQSLTNGFEIKIPSLAPININLEEYMSCQVVGYGSMKLNRSYFFNQPMISTIDVDVFPPTQCKEISRTYNAVIVAAENDYVCSYNKKYQVGSPLSQGDSGAPLICDNKVVGIAQWVFSAEPGYLSLRPSQPTPHLYTKIYNYKDWIFNTVNTTKHELPRFRKASIPGNNDSNKCLANGMMILFTYLVLCIIHK